MPKKKKGKKSFAQKKTHKNAAAVTAGREIILDLLKLVKLKIDTLYSCSSGVAIASQLCL